MARNVERQVDRVRRRLFLGSLLAHLAWCWAGALGLSAAWFAGERLLLADAPDWLRWAVFGTLMVVGTVLAVVLAVRRTPGRVSAALSLDAEFGLKERATTALTLDETSAVSPAGQALLADAESRVAALRVGDRFPLRVPRQAALLPAAALLLLLAFLFPLNFGGKANAEDDLPPADAKAAVADQMKKLAAKLPPKGDKAEAPKKEDLDKLDAELEKFSRRPTETRDQIKDRIREAQAIEEEIKKKQQDAAERREAFQRQMKQLERLKAKERKDQKGPADKLNEAVRRGDMEKAADELGRLGKEMARKEEEKERLRKKIRDPKTDEEEKKKAQEELDKLEKEGGQDAKDRDALDKQLKDLEDQLKELTRNKEDRKKDLDDKAEKGEIDKDQLDREKNEIDQDAEKLTDEEKKELEELAKELKECQQCMKEGKDGEAAKKLEAAAKKAGKMCDKDGDGQKMAQKLAMIQKVKKALCRAAGGAGIGAGRRPEAKDGDFDKEEKFSPAETGKGRIEVVGDGPKGGFKGARKPEELAEEIRAAAQDAPAAIDRQRLPPAARKMTRGYFEKLREQDGKKPEGK